jgi:hypothetical protein
VRYSTRGKWCIFYTRLDLGIVDTFKSQGIYTEEIRKLGDSTQGERTRLLTENEDSSILSPPAKVQNGMSKM